MQIHINLDTALPSDLKALAALAVALSNGQPTQSTSGSNQPVTVARLETLNEQSASSSVTTESQQQHTESGSSSSTPPTEKAKRNRKLQKEQSSSEDQTLSAGAGVPNDVANEQIDTTEASAEGSEPDAGTAEAGAEDAAADQAGTDQKALTLEFLRAQFTAKARADKSKIPAIRDLMKEFGVADLSGLAKDKYGAIYARLGDL